MEGVLCQKQTTTLWPLCILFMAYIIFCAMSMEINSSQPGIHLNNEDRAQHQFNYSSCSS